jgi:DNA-binding response OmpR family regulator
VSDDRPEAAGPATELADERRPPLVLVVEDEPQLMRFLRATLPSHGYRMVETTTGAQALVEASTRGPDLVLLDLGLPDLDGVEVTRRIREWSAVPILVVSARGQEKDKVEALDAGADDYLTKPFGTAELLARMRVALRHASRVAGGGARPSSRRASCASTSASASCTAVARRCGSPAPSTACSWRSCSRRERC